MRSHGAEIEESDFRNGLGGAGRVLIIDDSPSVIHQVRRVLEGGGYRVETLRVLVELPQRVKVNAPDVILLDLHMPSLPGVQVGALVRRYQSYEIPIIVYSSRPVEELKEAVSRIGAVGYVEKGCPDHVLLAAAGRARQRSSITRAKSRILS